MKIKFEHNYRQKIMTQKFERPFHFESKNDVLKWRQLWMNELSGWHSPYKVVVNFSGVRFEESEEIKNELDILVKFFKGFFMRKMVGYGISKDHSVLPIDIFESDEARSSSSGTSKLKKNKFLR